MTSQPKTLALALGLALAVPAGAAETSRTPAPPPHAAPAPAAATSAAPMRGAEVRASKLIGMNVHDRAGERLGEVKDVVLDADNGRVHYAVLSFGGFLGLGDKLFAVPLARVRADAKGALVLDVDKDELKSAPAFDSGRWPDWTSYRADVDRRYGIAPEASANARFHRASALLKAHVRDANHADIGDIKDVVVDLVDGRVHYVVVEFDRAWNPNDKLVALPMAALGAMSTAAPAQRNDHAAAPPRSTPGFLSLERPSGPTKGPASATKPPGGMPTRPPAIDPSPDAAVRPLPREPLATTTSYADDEDLVYKGTREQLRNAPEFDRHDYPDLRDAARREAFDRRLSNWRSP